MDNLSYTAYLAAGGNNPNRRGAKSRVLRNISKNLMGHVSSTLQNRRNEFDKFANDELSRNATLNDEEFEALERDLKRRRKSYIWGNKKDKQMLMRGITEDANQMGQLDAVRKKLSQANNDDKTGIKNNNKFKESNTCQSMIRAMRMPPIKKDKKMGYMIEDFDGKTKFMTHDDISKIIDDQSVDGTSKDTLDEVVRTKIAESKSILPNQNGEFNYDMNAMNIRNSIINNGNIRSLIMDEHIPGRNFYDDLQEMLVTNTYGNLGIRSSDVNDPTPNTPITPEDANLIADEMLKDESLTKEYLTTYYTNYVEQNWNTSASGRKDGGRADFEKEFRAQRKKFGPGQVFEYRGKPYSTNYTEEDEDEFA